MNFNTSVINGISIINVKLERATMRDVDEFKKIIISEIEKNNTKIIIDLSECGYIDSTFLGTLIVGLRLANKKGGNIKLVASNSATVSMIELTGTSKILPVFKSREDAITSFN